MAFVNEIVSEEDIRKYRLDELMHHFRSFAWRSGRPSTFTHTWTIDRERDVYFIPVKTIEEIGPSGRPEPTRRRVCILNWQGTRVELTIDRAAGSSSNHSDSPFRIVWELISIDQSQLSDVSREEVLRVLKEALVAYGDYGLHGQVPDTVIEFKF
jgi:hypothetical protein